MAVIGNILAINMGTLKSGGTFALVGVVAPSEGEDGLLSQKREEGYGALAEVPQGGRGCCGWLEIQLYHPFCLGPAQASRDSGAMLVADAPVLRQSWGAGDQAARVEFKVARGIQRRRFGCVQDPRVGHQKCPRKRTTI